MGTAWVEKVLQLRQVLELRHGVMLAGPSGSGKSTAWRTLLAALCAADGSKGETHVIDAKALGKEALYGTLDPTTLEWTDGVFTKALREVAANKRGGSDEKRHWIMFDGDVDPEWAENLNSVLDDNKLLTLPSGERLAVPSNVRILLEVDGLAHATPATVSRCGMVWFSGSSSSSSSSGATGTSGGSSGATGDEGTVTTDMLLQHRANRLRRDPASPSLQGLEKGSSSAGVGSDSSAQQSAMVDLFEPYLNGERPLVREALAFAMTQAHVMPANRER
jgi:dynein heavy chain 1, cytosolic